MMEQVYTIERREGGHYKVKYECGPANNRISMEVEKWLNDMPDKEIIERAKDVAERIANHARSIVYEKKEQEEKESENKEERVW